MKRRLMNCTISSFARPPAACYPSSMPILRIKRFVREDLQAHPERLYVFGDNFQQRGLGGLAAACCGAQLNS